MSQINNSIDTTIPKISIVMAAYNEENDIGKALNSILEQTFTEWELIVINDGSTDTTADVIQSFVSKDNRIRLVCNKTNMRLSASLNKGIELAKADLIARADADDINLPERLARQYAFMQEHPEIHVLGTGAYLMNAIGERVRSVSLPWSHAELKRLHFLKTHFFHPSVMIRRQFFDIVGVYDTTFLRAQDKELWLRGLKFGCRYANLVEPLIEYQTDGYVRSWRSIVSRLFSLLRIAKSFKIKHGYRIVFISFAYAVAIKWRIYKPKSVRLTGVSRV